MAARYGYTYEDDVDRSARIERAIREYGAEPNEISYYWKDQLHKLHYAHHHEVEISYATTFEGYGDEFPFYTLMVTGEQDSPSFCGEKKLSYSDGGESGVDFCEPIGMLTPPEGAEAKLKALIEDLRGADMLPAEKTEEEIQELKSQGRILMPNIPDVGPVGWNVTGHSHVG